ncbi:MAG: shikimate dehydrogenase [Candidatus Accumulibacter sp.]|jgi:shikimate dehydrogenase|nr:shikimate dehydrogenase [Accumulibacter sp.]
MSEKVPVSHPVLCGSIAGSIGGMGVRLHNEAFRAKGLAYTYVSFEPSGAGEAIVAMRALGIRGLGVTMPFKEWVIPFLDALDPTAEEIGAVNTIVNDQGKLTGYNTDAWGAIAALREAADPTGKRIVVLGAGGGAKSVLWALKQYTGDIVLFNRDRERGKKTARLFDIEFGGSIDRVDRSLAYDMLINCTAVGFKSRESVLKRDRIVPRTLVFDAVFVPAKTALLDEAAAVGCVCVSGTRMLMHQACKQFELYTGVPAPVALYETMLGRILGGA